jgi:hypothetical protein
MKEHWTFNAGGLRTASAFLVVVAALVAGSAAQAAPAERSTSGATVFMSPTVIPDAWSALVRTDDGVSMTFHTTGLTPGTAATVWWVFFNNPSACRLGMFGATCGLGDLANPEVQASVQFAAGHVIGGEGVANYGGHFSVGATPVCAGFGLPCAGLLDARRADVHLVVRTHGPAIPGLVDEEISSFNGGCLTGEPNVGLCRNLQASVHENG